MFNWLSLIAGFFYIVLGIAVIVYKFFIVFIEPETAYPLGVLLIVYGLFRIGRAVYRLKKEKDEA